MSDACKNCMAPLLLSGKRLERENAELQKAHDEAKDHHRILSRDNLDLKLTIRRLSPQVQQVDFKQQEVNELHKALVNSSDNLVMLQSQQKALEAQNSDFNDELESRLGELAILKRIRETDKEHIRNLSSCLSTLEYQNALGQDCVQQEEEGIRRRDAALEELSSAVKERSELVNEWTERKAELKIAMTDVLEQTEYRPTLTSLGTCQNLNFAQTQFLHKHRPQSLFEELSQCKGEVQDALPLASETVSAETLPKWRISAHLKQLICTASFMITLLLMLFIMTTSVPVCQPGAGVPCEDLLRDALQSVVLPYCSIHFPHTPPY